MEATQIAAGAPAKPVARRKKRETPEEERRRRVKKTTVGRFRERMMRIVSTLDELDPGKEMEQILERMGREHTLAGYVDDVYFYLSVSWEDEEGTEGGAR